MPPKTLDPRRGDATWDLNWSSDQCATTLVYAQDRLRKAQDSLLNHVASTNQAAERVTASASWVAMAHRRHAEALIREARETDVEAST